MFSTPADYTPKVFNRTSPCTKIDLHNCFFDGTRYTSRPVIEAQTVIGLNAPKHLLRKGYAVMRGVKGVDHYDLTTDGERWLHQGVLKFLAKHPDQAELCLYLPPCTSSPAIATCTPRFL